VVDTYFARIFVLPDRQIKYDPVIFDRRFLNFRVDAGRNVTKYSVLYEPTSRRTGMPLRLKQSPTLRKKMKNKWRRAKEPGSPSRTYARGGRAKPVEPCSRKSLAVVKLEMTRSGNNNWTSTNATK
jgi:hypothetical protein